MKDNTVFICITPTKNEAWILPVFLEINSQWADKFIVVDQCSTDGSIEILQKHPKVTLIKNENLEYDELYRSRLLWENVRKIKAEKRIVIALDADEYIPPALVNSEEWRGLVNLKLGTRIYMKWIEVQPAFKGYISNVRMKPFGYVDDLKEIQGKKIHSDRVPTNEVVEPYYCNEVVNLHLGEVPIVRNYKKHSWYLMWEYIEKNTSAFDLNLNYRKSAALPGKMLETLDNKWLPLVIKKSKLDIDVDTITWWDLEIIHWLIKYGEDKFKMLDIWNYDWNLIYKKLGNQGDLRDPRSILDKIIMVYIHKVKYKKNMFFVRILNYTIKMFWHK
ncbi:glycosyltransferase family 2 protein [Catalinimonas sp. 4WD22]|uniref:glycosyltransferase family 2 protein n=1 Tax=Catalinimonas locisalis TaxID=3133978 RepID=UPI003101A550